MSAIRVAINGAAGRMGQRLVALATADPEFEVVAAIETAGHPKLGLDAGEIAGAGRIGVPLADVLGGNPDVVIDFSTPAGAAAAIRVCLERSLPLVLATTGIGPTEEKQIALAAEKIPLLWSPNMSLAVNLAIKLSSVAATALKDQTSGVDVEIIERHHRYKEDAPSGTALKFGEIIARNMGQTLAAHGRHGRPGKRPRSEIGYHAVRTGDNPGEHTIIFGLLGETLEVTVKASSRDCYAQGALTAARFLVGKPAGFYSMENVLGL